MSVQDIVKELSERYGGVNKAARKIGMPEASMQAFHARRRSNPTLSTLRQLAAGLGVSLDEMARRFDLDHEESEDGEG